MAGALLSRLENTSEDRRTALHLARLAVQHSAGIERGPHALFAEGVQFAAEDLQQLVGFLLYLGEAAAAVELAEALASSPIATPETYLMLAELNGSVGGDALATLQSAQRAFPEDPQLLIELAKAHHGGGHIDEAREFARSAHAAAAADFSIAAEAIRLLIAVGAHDEALAAADESLREPGGHALALHMLALRAATSTGRHLDAYEHIRAVLDEDTGAGPSHQEFSIAAGELQQLASDLFHSGAVAEASDLARSMLVSGVVFPDTYLLLAAAEAELGGDALPTLELGVLRYPEHPFLLIELAKACSAAGQGDRAAEIALTGHQRLPSDAGIALECGYLSIAAKRYDTALSVAEAALGENAGDALKLHRLAVYAALAAGRPGAAHRHARAGMAIDPTDQEAIRAFADAAADMATLGDTDTAALRTLARHGDTELATSYFRRRLELVQARAGEGGGLAQVRALAEQALAELHRIGPELPLRILALASRLNAHDVVQPGLDKMLAESDIRTAPAGVHELVEALAGPFVARTVAFAPGDLGRQVQLAAELVQGSFRTERRNALYAIGAGLLPDDGVVRMNAGFSALAAGKVREARDLFVGAGTTDIYGEARVAWPNAPGNVQWPLAAFPAVQSLFEGDLAGQAWPRISLVTPSLNQGRYIEAAILSILNQNYPNLEYVVVDGGSADETPAILERYRDRIDSIVVAEGMDQTAALNLAIGGFTGELIGWLNTDDMLAPGALHAAAAAYARSRSDVIVGHSLIHRDGEVERIVIPPREQSKLDRAALLDIFGQWLKGGYFCQPEVFVARDALQRVGGALDPSLHYTMDYDLWVRLAEAGASMHVAGWPFAFFRKHEAQKTSNDFACFLELFDVRERHAAPAVEGQAPAAPKVRESGAQLPDREAGSSSVVEVCLWTGNQARTMRAFVDGDVRLEDQHPGADTTEEPVPPRIDIIGVQGVPSPEWVRARRRHAQFSVGWFWNCHDSFLAKAELSEMFDVVIPAHAGAGRYLSNRDPRIPHAAQAVFGPGLERPDGGRTALSGNARRNDRVCLVVETGQPGRVAERAADELRGAGYTVDLLTMGELARLAASGTGGARDILATYKVCVYLAASGEVTAAVLDALLMGVVPVVVLPPGTVGETSAAEGWGGLPVSCFQRSGTISIPAAVEQAFRDFETGGEAGAQKRAQSVLDGHLLVQRIAEIARLLSPERGR